MINLSELNPASGERLVSAESTIQFKLESVLINTLTVLVSGVPAIVGGVINNQFSDPTSSVTLVGSVYEINIVPKNILSLEKQYVVKIQVRDSAGQTLNKEYSFFTIDKKPTLISSTPKAGEVLTVPQVLKISFDDILDDIASASIIVSINGLNYIDSGIINTEYNGGFSNIDVSGTSCDIEIDPQPPLRNGDYTLSYSIADVLDNTLNGSIKFKVSKREEVLPTLFPQIQFLGFFQGIKRVLNDGYGDQLTVEWNKPLKRSYQNDGFILIYENESRLDVFSTPKYLVPESFTELTIDGLITGKTLSYAVRALEFPKGTFDTDGMTIAHTNGFLIPADFQLASPIDSSDVVITSETLPVGYPNSGFLLLDNELIQYDDLDGYTFSISERGVLGSTPAAHSESAKLFLGCTDSNTVIIMATPTYHDDRESDREINNIGLVVTDYTDNDRNEFQRFDYCGWRYNRPQDILYGKKDCGSYLGGEYNGFRGFNVYDRMLAQEEMLIEATGEPVVLLKRIWDGLTCSCMNNRKVSPKIRSCPSCYGTGYEGGYLKYDYPRRADGRILVSFKEAAEDLKYGEKEHLQQEFEPGAWTLAQPTIKDRDLLVRFDFTNDIEFIYEVLGVSRSKNFKRRFGRQDLTLKRLDKTDIVYTYALELDDPDINNPS